MDDISQRDGKAHNFRVLKPLFAGTVFVSAFLLFQVQPLISKAILPRFGGTPAVWTTCMLFFQLLLCGGYLYSHLLTRKLSPVRQSVFHLCVVAAAAGFLRILPSEHWAPAAEESPSLQITLLLLRTVGLPYFVLATTGPLLLRWYSLLFSRTAPYRLYALSNAGSLLALLTYPFVFEPILRLSSQAKFWSDGFLLFAGLCFACGAIVRFRHASSFVSVSENDTPSVRPRPVNKKIRVTWFLLAMAASATLLAETNEVCQDVAVIPFLWVIPLSLYLLSFILCFDSDRWYRRDWCALTTAVLVVAVCWLQSFGSRIFLPVQLGIYFGSVFSICMLCHGELSRLRPSASLLTTYYLTISAGGAAGGIFVGLIAPAVFPGYWEHHVCLLSACVIVVCVYSDFRGWADGKNRPSLFWVCAAILLFVSVGTVFAASVSSFGRSVAMVRNFYGVLEVERDPVEEAMVLRHGRILHGLQLESNPSQPTMYYGYRTGVGRAMEVLRERRSALRAGLVGLGIGTLAAYGKTGDEFRFYEINENVTRLAMTHFSFLKNCPSHVEIIPGDARLVLESETDQQFDLLVLDAFSGDAIPAHLLTQEAFTAFRRHVRPDGLIAVHISNIHFHLQRITDAVAATSGLHAMTLDVAPILDPVTGLPDLSEPGSRWVLMAENAEILKHPRFSGAQIVPPQPKEQWVLWTDDFSNLFQVLDWSSN